MSAGGPLPRFDEIHILRALELIGEKGSIGRKKLADKLEVGEGSVRTILNRLKEEKLIASTPAGHSLTDRGKEELEARRKKLVRIDCGDLTVGDVDVATIVRGAAHKVRFGVEERDEAIKAGADGATILVSDLSGLWLPDTSRSIEEKITERLEESFEPKSGDVIVIGTGSTEEDAERGVLAVVKFLSC